MSTYTIKQGECFASLAASLGLPNWKDLYEHPDNAELKKKRPNPNALAPGDVVVVPDSLTQKKTIACVTGQEHRFVVQAPRVALRLRLRDWHDVPYEKKRFEVTVAGTKLRAGPTAPD